jgi:RNA polymerase sigma-70 factor (ECF subfamily)
MTRSRFSNVSDTMEPVTEPVEPPGMTGRDGWSQTSEEGWQRLFRQIADGRLEAFDMAYELAADRLYGLALWHTGSREDASDVVQDVFVRVVEQGNRLRRVRRPRAWLLTVTHRMAVDVVRRRRRRRHDPLEDHPLLVAEDSDDPARKIDAERLARAVAGLSAAQRDAIYLRHFSDCSFSEIGRIVGVPQFTAASRYRLGLARVRATVRKP